ncbi:MAG TPA: outer membrane lipoprotein carrier protein LolA [Vicinamibacterales bacterium]|nr:outer membrane lipoprotein carrier protein LolA [Vicinamibacterales bacterium]
MKLLAAVALAIASVWTLHAQAGDPVAMAAKVQQRYNGIKDIQGDFVQTYEGGVLRTKTTERGTIAIKRPGKMRFVYTKPEKKEFVSDGNRLYSYLVADKQVIVSPAPGPDQGDIPAMFLAGQSDLARDYTPSFSALPGAATGLVTLKLVPRKKSDEYESIGIGVDPATLQIQFLTAVDTQGGRSSFSFSNLKENRGLADKEFVFRIPRGVDVVTNGARVQ